MLSFLKRPRVAGRFLLIYVLTVWRLTKIVLRGIIFRLLSIEGSGISRPKPSRKNLILLVPVIGILFCKLLFRKLLVKPVMYVGSKVKFIHTNISSRVFYEFADSCSSRGEAATALAMLREQNASGDAAPHKIVCTLMLALKSGELEIARSCARELVNRHPSAYSEHQQAGVWFFIGGFYSDAEVVWGQTAELREDAIGNESFDLKNKRILGKSWLLAIGHIAHIDIYIKHKILTGNSSQRTIIQLPQFAQVPNMPLLNIWSNHIEIRPSDWDGEGLSSKQYELLVDEFWSLRLSPGETRMFSHAGAEVQSQWERSGREPLLQLPPEIEARSWTCLESLGIPQGAWFVCLHVRESGFHKGWHDKHPGTRNADVMTYLKAVQLVIDAGGWVVRMGDSTMRPLPECKGLIDYAHSSMKSPEMDVFLCAKARFFIGTNSGLGLVPPIFGVQCALTNWTPIALPQWYGRDRFIPKTIYSKKLGRPLTLTELLGSPVAWQQFQSYFDEHGLEVRDNTEDEIADLVDELLQETSGSDPLTPADKQLSDKYNQLAVRCGSYAGARLGQAWLRKHAAELQSIECNNGVISNMP
jgi:putative glycosyltransferase (TIGR04372 family)